MERHVALAVFVRLHKLAHVLFNIQCFLDDWLQFFCIRRGGENGAVTVDEEHGTSAIAGSVFAPHIVFVVQFQEALPRIAVFLRCVFHILSLAFTGDGYDCKALVFVLLINGNHGLAVPTAGTAPRCPKVDESHLATDERRDGNDLAIGVANIVVDVGLAGLKAKGCQGCGNLLVNGMTFVQIV